MIRGILRGRRDDFALLVERYQRPVYAVVLRLLGDPDAADEVTQIVFIRAYTALRTFRGDASLKTWLLHIATNECRSWARRNQRRRDVPLDDVAEPELEDSSPRAEDYAERRGLERHVRRLPQRQRSVLALRVYGDLPFAEIARIEGITENAAKVNFHLAVKQLREWLQ